MNAAAGRIVNAGMSSSWADRTIDRRFYPAMQAMVMSAGTATIANGVGQSAANAIVAELSALGTDADVRALPSTHET